MPALLAFYPLIELAIKCYMQERQATAEELAQSVAHLNQNEVSLDALIAQIETDPILADLVAKRHNTEFPPSTDAPPPIDPV